MARITRALLIKAYGDTEDTARVFTWLNSATDGGCARLRKAVESLAPCLATYAARGASGADTMPRRSCASPASSLECCKGAFRRERDW